jgi:hypothetical protein
MRKYYSGITAFKLVGSLLVVLAHIRLPEFYGRLATHVIGLEQAMAFTVPCFYAVSGFLACRGWRQAPDAGRYLRRYLLWIGALYGVFLGAYIATDTLPGLLQPGPFNWTLLRLVFDVALVHGPSPPLWFIPPLVFGIGLTYCLERRNQLPLLAALTGVGLVLALLCNGTLRVVVERLGGADWQIYHFRQAFLLAEFMAHYLGTGLPAVLLGVWAARYEDEFRRLWGWRLALLCAGCMVAEVAFLSGALSVSYHYRIVASTLPVTALLFGGVLRLQVAGIQRYHTLINRFSILAYFIHYPLIICNGALLGVQTWPVAWNTLVQASLLPPIFSPWQALACAVLTLAEVLLLTALLHGYLQRRRARQAPVLA